MTLDVDGMTLDVDVHRLTSPAGVLIGALKIRCAPGQIVTVMGPSGCGKSSLLAAVAGTLAPELRFEGRVRLAGRDITHLPTRERGIGLLFQDDLLFAHLSVRENLLLALPSGPRATRRAAADEALASVGLAGLGERDPATLSGGQRTRVALMRALLAQPRALLLDEPFSRLDADLRAHTRASVFAHLRQRGVPALLVTHDAADVADAGQVIRLSVPGAVPEAAGSHSTPPQP